MGAAGIIFEPHPPNFKNLECSVQICSCPCISKSTEGDVPKSKLVALLSLSTIWT